VSASLYPRGDPRLGEALVFAALHEGPTISRIVEPSSVVNESSWSSFETCTV
jgi:hypothetical protein